ncbi:MAG: hypothetical protein COV74_03655 [Candidatus Omnitrophica bacterium CG11_big_fil_rev_8_21_14_0_20_45_26]|uniref:Fatty acid hydroxylase domain-containing protein n=1 Tax=Candidatus Abzuiibacterium crystallinum TaxID=1974748 RepID=A0A2H0LT51_9BACT|nr:MAG: hypothetical protein COV74_03655 [Candidatus Omnitrophica bacterium CG11_big_fil_rev_8_21_14_0_20_45_26]PIW64396.1 MAG: hypothetical protein COW12_06480 [Candidatus Omnitrophica bacterium CG12_big_fil_rev_8_21_14_0_65_45_16]
MMNQWQIPRTLFLAVLLVILFFCEQFWPARPWHEKRWRRWGFHLSLSFFNTVLTRLCMIGLIVFWIEYVQAKQWGMVQRLHLNGISEILLTIIVFDGLNYWWHRWNHRIPFLWRFHRVHHFDTHVDTSTALRFHFGELFLSYFVKAIWVLWWGPSLAAFLCFETAITAYALFHHTNIDFPNQIEQGLRWIHMTPRVHASHHTVSLRTRDANFSTIFMIWDRIFSTFREPDFEEMKTLGVTKEPADDLSWKVLLFSPFQ